MKLLGIVVLYRPKREFVANIRSYLKGVDRLIVWLNSAVDKDSLSLMERDNVIILGTGENLGIGAALNKAVAYALDNGFTHLLTMDQDSSFDPVTFCKYRDEIDLNTDNKVGCFAPDHGWNDIDDKTGIVKTTITSGAVYPISVFNEVGLFRDDFVIDGIDTEFCYRLRSKGYSISCVRHIGMNHHLGNSTLFKIGRYTFSSINYPPYETIIS